MLVIAVRFWRRWIFLLVSLVLQIVGALFMFGGEQAVHPLLAVLLPVLVTPFLWIAGGKTLDALAAKPSYNLETLVGALGEAKTDVSNEGSVAVNGELWTARSSILIPKGSKVRVVARDGLSLGCRTGAFTKTGPSIIVRWEKMPMNIDASVTSTLCLAGGVVLVLIVFSDQRHQGGT